MKACARQSEDGWRVTTALLAHQRKAVDKLKPLRVGGLFMEMGTGKTLTALRLVELARKHIDRVIWFCPASLKKTIEHEILKHTDCRPDDVYLFDHKTREERLSPAFWQVVGLESMSSSARCVFAVQRLITKQSFVVVDESSFIKGVKSKRTERITRLAEIALFRLILTGTPLSQGVQDLYAQMRFLSPAILGYRSWYTFERNHLIYSDRYPGMVRGYRNVRLLVQRMRPYVYQVKKSECLDLPRKLYESRYCDLTSAQWAAHDRVMKRFEEEVLSYENLDWWEQDEWSNRKSISTAIFRMFTDLQKIVCGMDPEGEPLSSNRLDLLMAVIGEIPANEKVVIWCKYHYNINQIVNALSSQFGEAMVAQYHGKQNERQRHAALQGWREKSGRFLVATQAVGGYGLDMTESCYAIFYSNSFKYAERLQAEDRFHRIGQERNVTYIDLWADVGIERRIEESLARKENVVERFKREVGAVKDIKGDELKRLLKTI